MLTLTFSARYRWPVVLVGITVATALLMAVSVTLGGLAGTALPERAVEIVAGVVFLGFAVWTLRDEDDDEGDDAPTAGSRGAALPAIVGAFALSELGDKTMLAAVALASTGGWLPTWAGATLGMVGANVLALVIGDQVGARVPERAVRLAAAGLFALFGVLLLLGVG